MARIAKLWNDKFEPVTDELLDLGSETFQWKDIYINGVAYIDQLNIEGLIEMNDFDIISISELFGLDNNIFINMGVDGRIFISVDGTGTPFATPDIDITGSTFFDDDMGLDTTKGIYFRDTLLFINSADDGHLDLNADIAIDLNAPTINLSADLVVADDLTVTDDMTVGGDLTLTTGWIKAKGYHLNIVTKVTDYVATVNDDVILVNPTSGTVTITLPNVSSAPGKIFFIKSLDIASGSESVVIDAPSAETIDGNATYTIVNDYDCVALISDGVTSDWHVLSILL